MTACRLRAVISASMALDAPTSVAHADAEASGVDRLALISRHDDRVAVASYDGLREPRVGEVAFAVADDDQHRAIGMRMLEQLAEIAADRGIHRLDAEVMAGKGSMLGVFEHAGFAVRRRGSFGEVTVSRDITPTEAVLARVRRRDGRDRSTGAARAPRWSWAGRRRGVPGARGAAAGDRARWRLADGRAEVFGGPEHRPRGQPERDVHRRPGAPGGSGDLLTVRRDRDRAARSRVRPSAGRLDVRFARQPRRRLHQRHARVLGARRADGRGDPVRRVVRQP